MLADLWHAPDAINTLGTSAVGSSEACMLAGLAAKWRWRARRRAEGKPTDNPNMVCGPVQVVWHKFGLAPLGVGWVLFRDHEELPDDLVFHVNYLGGDMPDFQINFSRPAGQVIAQYYNFLQLGFEGYKRIHDASYAIGQYIAAEIPGMGPFELLCDSNPLTGIPTVTWRIREGADPGYSLFDLADRLRARGWQVPAYTLTGTASDIAVQRVLVRLGVSWDMATLLLDDFRNAVAYFDKHPVTVSLSEDESSRFNHT
jgi:glutamate decarboxylase